MQYAVMIYAEPGYDSALPDADREAISAEYQALADDDRFIAGARLQSVEMATCVRAEGGRTLVSDGPFADTKEVLGGFCIIEAASLDQAIEFATHIPATRLGGGVEIRPVLPR